MLRLRSSLHLLLQTEYSPGNPACWLFVTPHRAQSQMSTSSDYGEDETEGEVVELSEGDLLQLLDSQEPALQVGAR